MGPKKYSLDPLVRVRRERAVASVRELATSIQAREAAERTRCEAEAERARRAEEARRSHADEVTALEKGELTAADLQRQGAWQAREAWDDQARGEQVAAAVGQEKLARDLEARARSNLATAEGEAKVVTEHRGRWVAEGERALEAAAEEQASEAWRPRR
jgi:hypothetical protein